MSSQTQTDFLSFISQGWQCLQDIYWVLTVDESSDEVQQQARDLFNQVDVILRTPSKQKPPDLSETNQLAFENINRLATFTISMTYYLGKACFYGSIANYCWSAISQFVVVISLISLVASIFLMTLYLDFKEVYRSANFLHKRFSLVTELLKGDSTTHPNTRGALAKAYIKDAVDEVQNLSQSLMIFQYILSPVLSKTEDYLKSFY